MRPKHTDQEYERELQNLRKQIVRMGQTVEAMIESSVRALVNRDTELAQRVVRQDHDVNRLEVETDELCLRLLARWQPMASDLRFITIALKIVTDLERIGDLCVNTCERVIELNAEPPLKPYIDIPRMADLAGGMVREALEAFVEADADRAAAVIERDKMVDVLNAQTFRELLTYMLEDPHNIRRATRIQSISKYLERIADHATNLAEMVVFMVRGKDVRHLGLAEPPEHRTPRGILFLCVHNSARSQMAEGWARKLLPPSSRVYSAGSLPAERIHPLAVRAMAEVGIDISGQKPKRMSEVPIGDVDTVITLCAEEVCVTLPETMRGETWVLPDPAAAEGSDEERLAAFRQVRNEIRKRIEAYLR